MCNNFNTSISEFSEYMHSDISDIIDFNKEIMIPEINSENCHQDLSDIINFSNDFNVPKITLIKSLDLRVSESKIAKIFNQDFEFIQEMLVAYYACRKHKRSTLGSIEFEMDFEIKLLHLAEDIYTQKYETGKSVCFVVRYPRYREVFAAPFRDRIPHHFIYNKLNPFFERIFGDRIFNCREGMGQLYGVHQLYTDIKDCSYNYTQNCYVCKLDLKAFFMSINKKTLAKLVDNFIVEILKKYPRFPYGNILRWLCQLVILNHPEEKCVRHSPLSMWKHLPKEKSLFTNGKDLGIAIGNLFAQLFANFILWFIEDIFNKYGIIYHGRYVDDIYMVDRDKSNILRAIPAIRQRLSQLGLRFNEKKFYLQSYTKGIKFTGAVIMPGRIYALSRNISNLKKAIKNLNNFKSIEDIKKQIAIINSLVGLLRQYNNFNTRKRLLNEVDPKLYKEYIYIKHNYKIPKGEYQCLLWKYKYNPTYDVKRYLCNILMNDPHSHLYRKFHKKHNYRFKNKEQKNKNVFINKYLKIDNQTLKNKKEKN